MAVSMLMLTFYLLLEMMCFVWWLEVKADYLIQNWKTIDAMNLNSSFDWMNPIQFDLMNLRMMKYPCSLLYV